MSAYAPLRWGQQPRFSLVCFARAISIALAVSACGGGGTSVDSTPTISISVTPSATTVQAGSVVPVTAAIARGGGGGASASVALTIEGTPSGVTANVEGGASTTASSAVINIAAASSTAPGVYSITVRARESGATDATTTVSLTVTAATPPSFLLTADAGSVTTTQGATLNTSVGITRIGGFGGAVTLAAEGLPAGITASFNPNPVISVGSALTLTVAFAAPPGSYPVIIRGTAAGLADVTARFTLVVNAAPTLAITVGSRFVNVVQGAAAQTFIKTTRSAGFSAAATYSVTGSPLGLTATIAPSAVADSLTLSLTTTASLTPGSYALTVHATAPGALESVATMTVTVASLVGADVRLDFSLCPRRASLVEPDVWVAYQDGGGAWTTVSGNNHVYSFHVNGATGAIAVVRTLVQFSITSVQYLTQGELRTSVASCGDLFTDVTNPYPSGEKTVNGTFARLDVGDYADVALGTGTSLWPLVTGPATTFQLQYVADGPLDLLSLRRDTTGTGARDRMVLRRDQNIPDGGTLAPIDFDGAEAFAPATANFPLTGVTAGGNAATAYLDYYTGSACSANRLQENTDGRGTFVPAIGIPPAQQRPNDLHVLTVTDDGNYTGGFRYALSAFRVFAARTIALGGVMPTTAAVASVAGGYKRLHAEFTPPAEYESAGLYMHDAHGHIFTVTHSGAFRGTIAAQLTMPDLTGANGFNAAQWAPNAIGQVRIFGKSTTRTSACGEGTTIFGSQVITGVQ